MVWFPSLMKTLGVTPFLLSLKKITEKAMYVLEINEVN
jgi:hypothetical protein